MSKLLEIIALTAMAGLAMPAGGLVACLDRFQSKWLVRELRHSVTAFGGGVLLSAVALVLVPEGLRNNTVPIVIVAMLSGGVAFLLFDQFLAARKPPAAQLTAMLSDFIPEAMALGAAFASERSIALLLALLIALQNLPEGFNAFRELAASGKISRRKILLGFTVLAAAGADSGHDRAGVPGEPPGRARLRHALRRGRDTVPDIPGHRPAGAPRAALGTGPGRGGGLSRRRRRPDAPRRLTRRPDIGTQKKQAGQKARLRSIG